LSVLIFFWFGTSIYVAVFFCLRVFCFFCSVFTCLFFLLFLFFFFRFDVSVFLIFHNVVLNAAADLSCGSSLLMTVLASVCVTGSHRSSFFSSFCIGLI